MRTIHVLTLVSVLSLPLAASAESYEVTASGLRVRKQASTNSGTLRIAPRGARLQGASRSSRSSWVKVSYGGVSGYVYGKYIKEVRTSRPSTPSTSSGISTPSISSGTSTPSARQTVTASGLNLRSGAGTGNSRLRVLPRGTGVQVLSQNGSWSKVKANGQTGWVYSKYLSGNTTRSDSGTSTAGNVDTSKAPWIKIAKSQVGVNESSAAGRKKIREYHKLGVNVAYGSDIPWCASFVNWALKKAGKKGTNNAMARSFETLRGGKRLSKPKVGCIVTFWRVSRASGKGHVGFYMGSQGNYIRVLGGNQRDAVSARNFSKSTVTGYIWPTK